MWFFLNFQYLICLYIENYLIHTQLVDFKLHMMKFYFNFFLPYVILKYNNNIADITVIEFAKIMEGLCFKKPYISQSTIPIKNIKPNGDNTLTLTKEFTELHIMA